LTKIYMMRMSLDVAIAADSLNDAYELARKSLLRDAVSDSSDEVIDVEFLQEIKKVEELKHYNWDGMCIPYGDTDGNTRLKDMLV
jgi:hypothetical protein